MTPGLLDMLTVVPIEQVKVGGISWVKRQIKERCRNNGVAYARSKWRIFWSYFKRAWLQLYDPTLWNVHGLTERLAARTNNPFERFNRELNSAFSTPHPSLAVFVTTVEAIPRQYVATFAAVRGRRARGRRRETIQLPVAVETDRPPEEKSSSAESSAEEEGSESEGTNQEALAALARSRSEARRRQSTSPARTHTSPTRSRSPSVISIHSRSGSARSRSPPRSPPGSPPRSPPRSPPGSPPRSPPGSPPGSPRPRALVPPLFPIGTMIPGFNAPRALTQGDADPWPSVLLRQLQITGMILSTLTHHLLLPEGWLFPAIVRGTRQPVAGTGYRDDLITGPNITALLAACPWQVLRNPADPLTFDLALHRGAATPLGRIATAYLQFEDQHRQAFWETTHYLPITGQQRQDPVIGQYHADRRSRRIRLGDRWRQLVATMLPMMRAMWADVDLLLDPFFLQIPVRLRDSVTWYPGVVSRAANAGNPTQHQGEPTDLLATLIEADTHAPGQNQYRDRPQDHPARRIPRLRNKLNPNVGAQRP